MAFLWVKVGDIICSDRYDISVSTISFCNYRSQSSTYTGLLFIDLVPSFIALYLLAHFQRASTIYTVTNKRIVLKIGAALPISYNIPFKQISSVDLKSYGVKGSIAISLLGDNKISYLSCWPHVRPWHFSKPCPSLLFLDNIEEVSQIIKKAMEDELIFSKLKNNDPNTPFQQLDSNSYKRVSIA